MVFLNSTRMIAGYTIGRDAAAREWLVVVIKGTFRIPKQQGALLELNELQQPLIMSDVYFGEPGLSAPRYEVDYAPRKSRCDILVNATAYAPQGRSVKRLPVGVRVGSWEKSFVVVGDRVWVGGLTGAGASVSGTRAFSEMPVTYERAFGGVDAQSENPADHVAFMENPVGRGYHKHLRSEWLEGSPLPNTEEADIPVTRPDGGYRPMSFGPVGRHWTPRAQLAGTYDQRWLDDVFPFLPADFDEQYYQSAPTDQQLPIPVGKQLVTLVNLTRDGQSSFVLPHFDAPVHVFPRHGTREDLVGQVDTVIIEPDEARVMMTWRVNRPLRRDLFEIAQVVVGRPGSDWWQKRETVIYPLLPITDAPSAGETEQPHE